MEVLGASGTPPAVKQAFYCKDLQLSKRGFREVESLAGDNTAARQDSDPGRPIHGLPWYPPDLPLEGSRKIWVPLARAPGLPPLVHTSPRVRSQAHAPSPQPWAMVSGSRLPAGVPHASQHTSSLAHLVPVPGHPGP